MWRWHWVRATHVESYLLNNVTSYNFNTYHLGHVSKNLLFENNEPNTIGLDINTTRYFASIAICIAAIVIEDIPIYSLVLSTLIFDIYISSFTEIDINNRPLYWRRCNNVDTIILLLENMLIFDIAKIMILDTTQYNGRNGFTFGRSHTIGLLTDARKTYSLGLTATTWIGNQPDTNM